MNVTKWNQKFTKLAGLALLGVSTLTAQAIGNNVRVALEGELLVIEGDSNANQITLTTNGLGDVSVVGRNGTAVNRTTSVVFRRAVINAVEIRMNEGNDNVIVNNMQIRNDLFTDLGAGNDSFTSGSLPSTVGAVMTVEGGMGNDIVRITGWSVGSDFYLDGQVGTLLAQLTALNVGFGLKVVGDAANDSVTCTNCTTGDFTMIETKGGADRVTLTDHLAFGLSVQTDLGADTVNLDSVSTLEDIEVNTGTERDIASFLDVQSGKNIVVSLDAGDDAFIGFNVFAEYDATFNGGAGTDRFQDGGVTGGIKTEILEFEIFK